jgi:hypothetical protein
VPTKRRKVPHKRINEPTLAWAERFLATGEEPPDDGGRARDEYLGWLFFGETVPGLPDPLSKEGRRLRGRNADQT